MEFQVPTYSLPYQSLWDKNEFAKIVPNQFFADVVNEKEVSSFTSEQKTLVKENTGVSEVICSDDLLRISLSLGPFDYMKVRVFIDGEKVQIDAEHEEVEDENHPEHTISRKLTRKYVLPNLCSIEGAHSYAFVDKLVVIVPRMLAQESREISVLQLGDSKKIEQGEVKSFFHKIIEKVKADFSGESNVNDCISDYSEVKNGTESTIFDSIVQSIKCLAPDAEGGDELSKKESLSEETPVIHLEVGRDLNKISAFDDSKESPDSKFDNSGEITDTESVMVVTELFDSAEELKAALIFGKKKYEDIPSCTSTVAVKKLETSAVEDVSFIPFTLACSKKLGAVSEPLPISLDCGRVRLEPGSCILDDSVGAGCDSLLVTEKKPEKLSEALQVVEEQTKSFGALKSEEEIEETSRELQKAEVKVDATGAASLKAEEKVTATGAASPKAEAKVEATGAASPKAEEKVEATGAASPKAEEKVEATGAASPKAEAKVEATGAASPKAEAKVEATGAASPKAEAKVEATGAASPKAEAKVEATGAASPKAEAKVEATGAASPKAEEKVEDTGASLRAEESENAPAVLESNLELQKSEKQREKATFASPKSEQQSKKTIGVTPANDKRRAKASEKQPNKDPKANEKSSVKATNRDLKPAVPLTRRPGGPTARPTGKQKESEVQERPATTKKTDTKSSRGRKSVA